MDRNSFCGPTPTTKKWPKVKPKYFFRKTLGLYIVYFMRYDTYHDTHEVIFDMSEWYIFCLIVDPKTNFLAIWEF